MNRTFFAATLRNKPHLLRAMLSFNGLRRLSPLPESLHGFPHAAALWQEDAVRRRYDASCAPKPDFWDFEDESCRLALLDAPTRERLVLTFGVAVLARDICRLLRKNEVRAAREGLGDALYTYAVHRAPYQVDPDVVPDPTVAAELPIHLRARALGADCLRTLASRWPQALRDAVTWDAVALPESHDAATPADRTGEQLEQHRRLWIAVKKVLLKEVAPAWTPCFD